MDPFTSKTIAVADEAEALLDAIGENGEAILTPGDDGTAAVVGLLEVVAGQQYLMGRVLERVGQAQEALGAPLTASTAVQESLDRD